MVAGSLPGGKERVSLSPRRVTGRVSRLSSQEQPAASAFLTRSFARQCAERGRRRGLTARQSDKRQRHDLLMEAKRQRKTQVIQIFGLISSRRWLARRGDKMVSPCAKRALMLIGSSRYVERTGQMIQFKAAWTIPACLIPSFSCNVPGAGVRAGRLPRNDDDQNRRRRVTPVPLNPIPLKVELDDLPPVRSN